MPRTELIDNLNYKDIQILGRLYSKKLVTTYEFYSKFVYDQLQANKYFPDKNVIFKGNIFRFLTIIMKKCAHEINERVHHIPGDTGTSSLSLIRDDSLSWHTIRIIMRLDLSINKVTAGLCLLVMHNFNSIYFLKTTMT